MLIKSSSNAKLTAWFVILVMPLSGMGVDIYAPALVKLVHVFGVSASSIKSSISVYLLGYGAVQVVWGPLCDRFGRKKISLIGLYLLITSSVMVLFRIKISTFLLLRFLQGVGIAAANTANRAMLVDSFSGADFKKYMTYTSVSWSVSPIAAPVLGAYLIKFFGWKSCFVFLSCYTAIMIIWLQFFIKGFKPPTPDLTINKFSSYLKTIFGSKVFNVTLLMVILTYSSITIFNVTSPFLIQKYLHKSVVFYGNCAALVGIGWFLGNLISSMTAQIPNYIRIRASLAMIVLASLVMLFCYNYFPLLWVYLSCFFVIVVGSGFIFPIAYVSSFAIFPELAGVMSGVVGSVFCFGGGFVAEVSSYINLQTPVNLFIFHFAVAVLLCLSYIFLLLKQSDLRKS